MGRNKVSEKNTVRGKLHTYTDEMIELVKSANMSEEMLFDHVKDVHSKHEYKNLIVRIANDLKYMSGVGRPFLFDIYPRMCAEIDDRNINNDMITTLMKQVLKICYPNVYAYFLEND